MDSFHRTGREFTKNLEVYNAAVSGDWETANTNREQSEAIISYQGETALHVAVQSGRANVFVLKLVGLMSSEALAIRDRYGNTALHEAAKVGNIEAAIAMLDKNPDLLYMLCDGGRLPVTTTALYSKKDMLEYLIFKSKPHVQNSPFQGELGIALLVEIIGCQFLDVALNLVESYPDLARLGMGNSNRCALSFLAEMEVVFPSREIFTWWQQLIYCGVPDEESRSISVAGDIESKSTSKRLQRSTLGKLQIWIWKTMEKLVPPVKEMKEKKEMHKRAVELAKYLCREMKYLPEEDAWNMLQDSMFRAAEHGISEIVEVIMEMYPVVTGSVDSQGRSIMHLAAANRFENVFNLTYNMSDRKHLFSNCVDFEGNNLLHMCARLAPSDKLNLVPGAALQMQRELQWFNEMQRFVPPSRRKWADNEGTTPKKLFTEQHKELKVEGEKWMKDTANACSITTALIATVVFAASFTVPGGVSDDTGIPIFLKRPSFLVFVITNTISLFTSITSLMLFLSILTSRYAEGDFLYVLPKRLSIGLLTLFVSITFMLVAFGSALYLVLRSKDEKWFIVPVIVSGSMPLTTFVLLQFPLLKDVIYSTYGPGIFGKKTDRVFF